MPKAKTREMRCRVTEEMYQAAMRKAKDEDIYVSEVMRKGIARWLLRAPKGK